MIDKDKIKEALELGREYGLAWVEVDGMRFPVPKDPEPEPEEDGKDLAQPKTPYDDMDDDEVLFWSTPYYEELHEKREAHAQKLKEEQNG